MAKFFFKLEKTYSLKKCVLTYGHFDSIHPGHLRYLKKASSQGRKLVIALLPDTKKGVGRNLQFSQKERADVLSCFNFVDAIIFLEDKDFALLNVVQFLEPISLFLGREFEDIKDEEITSAIEEISKLGIKVKFHAGHVQYSSTKLLENPKEVLMKENKKEFQLACKKQKLNSKNLLNCIDSFSKAKILVLGDSILDQYAGCEPLGISSEAPVLVVKELRTKNFIGGAAIVASHINSIGANCEFLSVVGVDENAFILKEKMDQENISHHLIEDDSRPTTFKKRYIVDNQKLFRVSKLNEHFIDKNIEEKMLSKLEDIAPNVDGIIVSDFVYGTVTTNIINKVINLAKKYNIKIFGDLQCSSQIGLVTKFKNFSLISPNEKEARIALQDKESGIEAISMKLFNQTSIKMLIMKLGAEGLIAYEKKFPEKIQRQSFPALSVNPVDLTGAGDALLAVIATSLCSQNDIMSSAAIGSCMAALAVENMGNKKIDKTSLKNYLLNLLNN